MERARSALRDSRQKFWIRSSGGSFVLVTPLAHASFTDQHLEENRVRVGHWPKGQVLTPA